MSRTSPVPGCRNSRFAACIRFTINLTAVAVILLAAVPAKAQALAKPASTPPAAAAAAPTASFEVASVRMIPEGGGGLFSMSQSGAGLFTMHSTSLPLVIAWAFGVDSDRVLGGPDWINDQEYDISARPEGGVGLTYEQVRPLVQQLLQDRFHLVCHRGTKYITGYALVVSGKALKLTPTKGAPQNTTCW